MAKKKSSDVTPAERILINLGITAPAEIDLEAVAWSLGAIVKFRALENCEARIVGKKRHAVISVNSDSLPTRQRFSIAHEIGHWHHHRGQVLFCGTKEIENPANDQLNRDRRSNNASDPERQADEFASDLILPNYLFRPRAEKLKSVTLEAARQLASDFNTSLTVTLIRVVKTDFPVILVCHGKRGRHWFLRPDIVPGWWFPKKELDPESFAFDMLFTGAAEDTFPRKIGADAWFEFRGASRFEIFEQSFALPNNEILTVLTIPDERLE